MYQASPVAQWGMQEMQVRSLGWEDPLEKEMATHTSILALEIPWTEEPGSPWGHERLDMTERLNTNKQEYQVSLKNSLSLSMYIYTYI